MSISLKISGVKTVVRNMDKLTKAIDRKTEEMIKRAALEVESEAVRLVPVDVGRLKGSIMPEKITDRLYHVGTDVEYSVHVEFGTHKQRAQPYLRPAAEKVKQRYPDIVSDTVINCIREI